MAEPGHGDAWRLRSQGLPLIYGRPVAEGYGVLIEGDRPKAPIVSLTSPQIALAGSTSLIAWLTKRNAKGEYEKVRRLDPDTHVSGWDTEGRAFTFENGIMTVTQVHTGPGPASWDEA